MNRRVDGLAVSAVGLGTASFGKYCDERAATEVVRAALDGGVTLFDTADSYGAGRRGRAEEILGRALRGHRDEVVLASKVGTEFAGRPATAHPSWIRRAVVGSLRRLGTDHLDLYLLHVPDPAVPVEDTLAAMAELRRSGLVRAIGCCNLSAPELVRAGLGEPASFRCVQDGYSVLDRAVEAEVLPLCRAREVAFIAYAPLSYGMLTGKYTTGVPDGSRLSRMPPARADAVRTPRAVAAAARFCRYSAELGLAPEQLALAWLLSRDGVTAAIPGATTAEQVRRNTAALARVPLPAGVLRDLDAVTAPG